MRTVSAQMNAKFIVQLPSKSEFARMFAEQFQARAGVTEALFTEPAVVVFAKRPEGVTERFRFSFTPVVFVEPVQSGARSCTPAQEFAAVLSYRLKLPCGVFERDRKATLVVAGERPAEIPQDYKMGNVPVVFVPVLWA